VPPDREPLLQGTLDLLILHALAAGPLHGHAIARWIKESSSDVLLVQEGSLYPALHRLEAREDVIAEWGPSENNRKARHYELTKSGRRRLEKERASWARVSSAIDAVLRPSGAGA
jgi:transcriptional regulator